MSESFDLFFYILNIVAVGYEGFPSFCFVPLCCVENSERQKEARASFAGI